MTSKKISMVLHSLAPRYGVSFHVGKDPDNRRPVYPKKPSDLSDQWGWYQCIATGCVVLALRADEDMHILGSDMLNISKGDWVAIDFVACIVQSLTAERLLTDYLELTLIKFHYPRRCG
jgi:hypothetical protein